MANTLTHGSASLWMRTAAVPRYAELPADAEADVCVIGAGIAGLTSAYLLCREGKSVIVIEALQIGAGETGRTTAHFFPPDQRYFNIEARFGSAAAKHVADSFRQATDLAATLVARERIDCEFERLDGYLFARPGRDGDAILGKELAAAERAGVVVERCEGVPGLSFESGPALRFFNQAQFHPLKYLAGLARALTTCGGRLHGRTRALGIEGDGGTRVVHTPHGIIRAKAVVVATNTPFNDRVVMHTKQAGYRTYVVAARVPRGSVPRILMWDTEDPYHYIRLGSRAADQRDEFLIVGGCDHKVGQESQPEQRYRQLEAWLRARFPTAGAIEFEWSGEVMEPADGVAYLGRNPLDSRDVYVITGDSGNGMTHCTAGAMLVTDLIMGRSNPWAELYDPARKPYGALSRFIREQADTLGQYADWLGGGEVGSVREIAPGAGAIVRVGIEKRAIYRDFDGALHALSAVCTHLGCPVAWNGAEKSWDCPCHGSRFDLNGEVLHGPATRALAPAAAPSGEFTPPAAKRGAPQRPHRPR